MLHNFPCLRAISVLAKTRACFSCLQLLLLGSEAHGCLQMFALWVQAWPLSLCASAVWPRLWFCVFDPGSPSFVFSTHGIGRAAPDASVLFGPPQGGSPASSDPAVPRGGLPRTLGGSHGNVLWQWKDCISELQSFLIAGDMLSYACQWSSSVMFPSRS